MSLASVRTRSIWRWQLILAAATVTVTATIAVLDPPRLTSVTFLAGIVAIVVLTVGALLVPWDHVPGRAVAVLPLAAIAAIGMMSSEDQTGTWLLWVFPIAWIATYYRLAMLATALGLIGLFLAVDAFVAGMQPKLVQRAVVVMLCLGFMGVTINVGARRARAFRHLLRRQFAQLDRTRRRAEQHARRTAILAASLDIGIARIDADGTLLDANRAFLDLFGSASLTEFSGTGAVEYRDYRGEPVALADTFLARAAAGEHCSDRRVWMFDARGAWRALNVTMRPIAADVVDRPSNIVIIHDVSDTVAGERERESVSTVVSHELRNPLTAILGHTDLLLEREDLPTGVRRQLAVIDHAGRRMERLVTSVLEGVSLTEEPFTVVDVAAVIEASLVAFGPTAVAGQILLSHDLRDLRPVWGDAFRLRQAIDNIVGNAIEYTHRGGVVHVSAAHTSSRTSVVVADTGIGMAPLDRDRMHEHGYRSEAAHASGIAGAGIGMAIVSEIVEQHSGGLEVESAPGRGTRVTITLPRPQPATVEGMPT